MILPYSIELNQNIITDYLYPKSLNGQALNDNIKHIIIQHTHIHTDIIVIIWNYILKYMYHVSTMAKLIIMVLFSISTMSILSGHIYNEVGHFRAWPTATTYISISPAAWLGTDLEHVPQTQPAVSDVSCSKSGANRCLRMRPSWHRQPRSSPCGSQGTVVLSLRARPWKCNTLSVYTYGRRWGIKWIQMAS